MWFLLSEWSAQAAVGKIKHGNSVNSGSVLVRFNGQPPNISSIPVQVELSSSNSCTTSKGPTQNSSFQLGWLFFFFFFLLCLQKKNLSFPPLLLRCIKMPTGVVSERHMFFKQHSSSKKRQLKPVWGVDSVISAAITPLSNTIQVWEKRLFYWNKEKLRKYVLKKNDTNM